MSKSSYRRLLPFAAAALLSLSAAQSALAAGGQEAYRRAVLGESTLSTGPASASAAQAPAEVLPGSYARYLMHLGLSADPAIAQARAAGEQPGLGVVTRESAPVAGGREAYERMLGRAPSADGRRASRTNGAAS
jgi:hypothetical protein